MKIRNKIISSILFFVLALSFMLFGCKSNDNDEILYIAPDLNCFPPSLGIDQMWRMYENGSIKNSIIISNVYLNVMYAALKEVILFFPETLISRILYLIKKS